MYKVTQRRYDTISDVITGIQTSDKQHVAFGFPIGCARVYVCVLGIDVYFSNK
jgi:hypothetical protein